MHSVHDPLQLPEVNREHRTAVTTTRPKAHSSCELAATHPSCGGLPKATRRHPADVEEDDKKATAVVPVTALVCNVVGWVPSFDRSRARQVADTVWLAKGSRECTAAVTTPSPIAHSHGDVAATHPNLCGHPKATGSELAEVEEDDQV
jgi:hypothetical protein